MKRYYFARVLRASGRLLLFIGTILGAGLIMLGVYQYIRHLSDPGSTQSSIRVLPQEATGAIYDNPNPTATIITATISIITALCLAAIIAKIYNGHMRSIIARIAHFFKAQIFTIEIIGTGLAWTVTTLLLIFSIPAASIVATFAFIINELLFILAWGIYGQPNYKI